MNKDSYLFSASSQHASIKDNGYHLCETESKPLHCEGVPE